MSFQQRNRTALRVNLNYWSFAITGKVRHPLILSFADLQRFPVETLHSAITCTATHEDRPIMSEADWRGVPLRLLLDEIAVDSAAQYARVHAADGYTTLLPLSALAETWLVYERNGAALTHEEGFPARLIALGLHGYKMAKWVNRVELSATADGGFWERYGWSVEGEADVRATILSDEIVNGVLHLSGAAYAGRQALTAVEVSVDGGDWMPVTFAAAAPFALTHWHVQWTPPAAGDYSVRVRATADGKHAEYAQIIKVR